MPNPYHDELGRFCSGAEMKAAIDRLQAKGDFNGYFELRKEYEAIEKGKVEVSEQFVSRYTGNYLGLSDLGDANDIKGIYRAIADKRLDPSKGHAEQFLDIAMHPNTPADIKEEILTTTHPELKNKMLEIMTRDNHPATTADLLTIGEGVTNSYALHKLIDSKKLTFEDKYRLAKQSPMGLAVLVETRPDLVFGEPTLRKEFEGAAEEAIKNYAKDPDVGKRYVKTLALHSSDDRLHNVILDNYPGPFDSFYESPLRHLVQNESLKPKTALKLMKTVAENNVTAGKEYAHAITTNIRQRNRFYDLTRGLLDSYGYNKPFKTDLDPVKRQQIEAELQEIESGKRGSSRTVASRANTLQAQLDAHASGNAQLTEALKFLTKRKAPDTTPDGLTLNDVRGRLNLASNYVANARFIKRLEEAVEDMVRRDQGEY